MGRRKGCKAHNRIDIDIERLVAEYESDRGAVRRLATEWGCSLPTLYDRLREAGVDLRRGGEATRGTQRGRDNPNWSGGQHVSPQGYVRVRVGVNEYALEHRLVAEEMLGRPLTESEVVHHKNGVKDDNRPENLEVLESQAEHMRLHMDGETARKRGIKGGKARVAALRAKGVEV